MVAFDLDGPTGDAMLSGDIWSRPEYFSWGAYGPWRGAPRLLDLLSELNVRATFFVPAWVMLTWPEVCVRMINDGHEVAHHGFRHERYFDLGRDQTLRIIEASQRVFLDVIGCAAVGFRAPSGDPSPTLFADLRELGFQWSSTMRGDDRPYLTPDGLVEIPARSDLDDYSGLAWSADPNWPPMGGRPAGYAETAERWLAEVDGHHQLGACLTTIWHPKVSGTPGKAQIIRRVLERLLSLDVWCATGSDIAAWTRQVAGAPREVAE